MIVKLFFSTIVLICVWIYYLYGYVPSKYVKSNIDNKYYLVKDTDDKQEIADMLATIRINILKLTEYMLKNPTPEYKTYIENLHNKLKYVVISENIKDFYYTSYSVNKGDELVFCLHSRRPNNQKHDINLVMYVALHEISHIACPTYGHSQLFKDIFKYITECAIEINIYVPTDFKKNPTEYCGMTITDSIV